jgi:dihydrofolate reductase
MSFSIIAAIGKNNELGKDNGLIWSIKEDLKFFKDTTMSHPIVMGSKTFYSLPKVLPGRTNIVISSKDGFPEEVVVYRNIDDLINDYKDSDEELFIIGGGRIYSEFIDKCDKLYLTEIDAECKDADTYFPSFNKEEFDREELSSGISDDISYKHVLYKRK